MKPARSHVMIMPDSQQSQHASREGAMHGQMGPHDAVPIFYGTTGSHGALPPMQQGLSRLSPCRIKVIQQVLGGGTQQGATLPCPGQQMNSAWSHLLLGL